MNSLRRYFRSSQGFSLLEMAISLLILGLAFTFVLPILSSTNQQKKIETDRNQLDQVKIALLQYAMINGRLPCPATHPSLGGAFTNSNGFANPEWVGATINCATEQGYLPAVTLNLPGAYRANASALGLLANLQNNGAELPEFAVRYTLSRLAVPPAALANAFANVSGRIALNGQPIENIATSLNISNKTLGAGLSICNSLVDITAVGCGANSNVFLTDLVAVIHSRGANPTSGSAQEAQNINMTNPRVFVYPPEKRRDLVSNPYDDELTTINFGELLDALSKGGWILNP